MRREIGREEGEEKKANSLLKRTLYDAIARCELPVTKPIVTFHEDTTTKSSRSGNDVIRYELRSCDRELRTSCRDKGPATFIGAT